MAQSYTPYSYQGNNIFNMGNNWWDKKRLLESPITAAEAESMSNPFMQVNEVQGTRFGSVNPHAGMGVKTNYSPSIPNNPHVGGDVIGVTPTVGNSAMSDAPKRNLDFTGYTKSLDKTFAMAALQSAIPQNDQTPARQAPSGGARGGGNRMGELTQYASAIPLDEEKYPMLWRYS
jgi:hypothetical protein